ncbi:MAG TPA: carbohydrate ABC transporter permease, partial [Streptomyces sp.]|nr:carbohydrate ABC transporter permease [Streptomyces sp.]
MTTLSAPNRPSTARPDRYPPAARQARRRSVGLGLLAWVVGISFCVPALWMLLTSFHSEADAATNPPSLGASFTL